MADGASSNKTLWIVVGVIAVWWLFFRKATIGISATVRPPMPNYNTGSAVAAVVTNAAPALGTFLGNLAKGFGSSSSSSSSSSSGGTYSFDDGLLSPSFGSSSAVSDDFDYSD